MVEPQVQWIAPAALWPAYANAGTPELRDRLRQPHILRFATDAFMPEFTTLLQNEPARLGEWVAQPETWRGPAAAPPPITQLPPLVQRLQRLRLATATPLTGNTTALLPAGNSTQIGDAPLKLYQPGHLRYYLVTACLVCRVPGLPDRAIDFGAGERVTYVVRRLRPKAGASDLPEAFDLDSCDEYALVGGTRWERATADRLAPDEEQNPLFGVTYVENDGRKRRILAAPIPVGKRETYLGAAADRVLPDEEAPAPVDPRKALLLRTVTDPWRKMIAQYDKLQTQLATESDINKTARLRTDARDQANLLSWYALLDLNELGAKYLPEIWQVITGAANETSLDGTPAAKTLYTRMKTAIFTQDGVTRSLAQALADIDPWRKSLEETTAPYSTITPRPPDVPPLPMGVFPDFVFPLHATHLRALVNPPAGAQSLDDLIVAALPTEGPAKTPPLPLAAALSTLDMREPGWFIIRCVFERPNCMPLTGPLLSEPTASFQMASFFDSDAPARPIRINLPLDTSAAGLRKFDRNTAFMVSDVLCGQMERLGNITFGDLVLSVLPWPFHKDLPVSDTGPCKTEDPSVSFGMICSLSIPIITICALILLIIIVNLLDIIFRWIPFFIMCFPLPRFKGKEAGT